MSLMADWGDHP